MKLCYTLATPDCRSTAVLAWRGDLEPALAALRGLGYDGVELFVRDPAALDQGALVRALGAHGLSVCAIGTGQLVAEDGLSFTDPDPGARDRACARTERCADLAARLGCQVNVGKLRGRLDPAGREAARARSLDCLDRVCRYAGALGVTVTLEPQNRYVHDWLHTARQGLAVIRELGLPNLKLMLDVFHMNIEEPAPLAALVAAREHLAHVHLADSNRRAPGAGHLDFAAILRTLRALDYRGALAVEQDQAPDQAAAAAAAAAYLRPLLDREAPTT